MALLSPSTFAQSDDEILEATRSSIKADRQAVVTDAMQFTPGEAAAFWPVYHQYRVVMNTVKRTASLRFEDGTVKTLPVRADVNMARRKVGEKVSFRLTEMVAIKVGKP